MRAMKLFSAALIALSLCGSVAAQNRWSIMPDGKTIRMESARLPRLTPTTSR